MDIHQFSDVDFGRIDPISEIRSSQFDFSVARSESNPLEVVTGGDFIYCGDMTDATIYMRLNSQDAVRFKVSAGFAFKNITHKRVYLDWEAQGPDKTCQLLYGVGGAFVPTNDISNIGLVGEVSKIAQDAILPRAIPETSYYIDTSSAALRTVFTPALNSGGCIVFVSAISATSGVSRIMAKKTPPPTLNDPYAISLSAAHFGNGIGGASFVGYIYLPDGYGIYTQTNNACSASLSYTLL